MGCFYPKKKMYELKTYRDLDGEFDPSFQKSQKSALKSAVFLPKCISSKYVSIYSEQ